jgi:hypothetical protein
MNPLVSTTRAVLVVALLIPTVVVLTAQLTACATGSQTAESAGRGAATGAVSGAVGGLVSALVFGGDPVDRAARGAVYGGAVGATAGAIAGSQADQRAKAQRDAGLAQLRRDVGEDAFEALTALAECNHPVSLRQAAKAQGSTNPNYALAGLWLEVLSHADGGEEAKARALFPTLVEKDWDIDSEAQAEGAMRDALGKLMSIRQEHGLPRVCAA